MGSIEGHTGICDCGIGLRIDGSVIVQEPSLGGIHHLKHRVDGGDSTDPSAVAVPLNRFKEPIRIEGFNRVDAFPVLGLNRFEEVRCDRTLVTELCSDVCEVHT